MSANRAATVPVWDRFVRVFHWSVVAAYAVGYITEGEPAGLHAWSGYVLGVLVVLRIGWGVVGPRHARFADFVYRPRAVVAYLRDMVRFRAPRHLGHSPAGGAMVVALLVFLALVVASGIAAYGEEGKGPMAGWFTVQAVGGEGGGEGIFKEVHEVLSNVSIFLIVAHLGGVALASLAHRENLVKSMVTGRKRKLP